MAIRIGVVGTGHLGRIHLDCITKIPEFELVGFLDTDKNVTEKIRADFGLTHFQNIDDLIEVIDALDIVTPTQFHFEYAILALKKFKHVFVEKPLVSMLSEAKQLMDIAHEAGVTGQVGHVERFNPAYLAALPYIKNPMFIETARLSEYNKRGTEVSVIFDLMIHDIDLVLNMVNANVRKISANGAAMFNSSVDIANARLEFDNGCVANLTASRVSMNRIRKMRVFQRFAMIKMDFLEKKTDLITFKEEMQAREGLVLTIPDAQNPIELYTVKHLDIYPLNAIQAELSSFAHSITNNCIPPVTLLDGYNSVDIANRIAEKIKLNN